MTDRDPLDAILGRIDRPVPPSADFARDLRGRLIAELERDPAFEGDHPPMSTTLTPPTVVRTPSVPARSVRPSGRWMPRLEAAAAVLLFFGVFAALGGPDQFRDRFAGLISRNDEATSDPLGPATMYGGNPGRTGQQPGPEPQYEFVDSWKLGVDGKYVGGFAPVGLGDTVYRAFMATSESDPNGPSTTYLQAVDIDSGTVRWQQALEVWGSPAVTADYVFVNAFPDRTGTPAKNTETDGDRPARLVALDARTGAIVWSIGTGATAGWVGDLSPIVLNDAVYTATPDGTVFAVDGRTGQIRWTSIDASSSESGEESRTGRPSIADSGQIAAGDGALFVVNSGGHLVALEASTGNRRWEIDVRDRFDIRPERVDPMVVKDIVVLRIRGLDESPESKSGGETIEVFATIEATTGDGLWRRDFATIGGDPAIAGGLLIVPTLDTPGGAVVAIDLGSSQDAWILPGTGESPRGLSVAGTMVLLSSGDGRLTAIDAASGDMLWYIPGDAGIAFASVVTREHVILQRDNGILTSYSTQGDGTPVSAPRDIREAEATPTPR